MKKIEKEPCSRKEFLRTSGSPHISSGIRNLWGITQGANVQFSFEFGFTEWLSLGFGRSSLDEVVDFTGRYILLKQLSDNRIPVSFSLNTSAGINVSSYRLLIG
jgi:hypothetical protein